MWMMKAYQSMILTMQYLVQRHFGPIRLLEDLEPDITPSNRSNTRSQHFRYNDIGVVEASHMYLYTATRSGFHAKIVTKPRHIHTWTYQPFLTHKERTRFSDWNHQSVNYSFPSAGSGNQFCVDEDSQARSYQPQLLGNAFIHSFIHSFMFSDRGKNSFLRKYKTIPNNSQKIT